MNYRHNIASNATIWSPHENLSKGQYTAAQFRGSQLALNPKFLTAEQSSVIVCRALLSSHADVAEALGIKEQAVKGYLKDSYKTLAVTGIAAAVSQRFEDGSIRKVSELEVALPPLSGRENDVLQQTALGFNLLEIAERDEIPPGWVEYYLHNIYEKWNVTEPVGAVLLGYLGDCLGDERAIELEQEIALEGAFAQ